MNTERWEEAGAFPHFLRKRFARLGPLHYATMAYCCVLAAVTKIGLPRYGVSGPETLMTFTHAWKAPAAS